MKKIVLSLIVLLAAALLFTSCGGNEPNNPAPAPAPVSYDGTWICRELVIMPGTYQGVNFTDGTTGFFSKVVISGNTYKMYTVDVATYLPALEAWVDSHSASVKPEPTWSSTVYDEGTIAINGSSVSITSTMHANYTNSGTIAADNHSFSMPDVHPLTNAPVTVTYVKQEPVTIASLAGTWTNFECDSHNPAKKVATAKLIFNSDGTCALKVQVENAYTIDAAAYTAWDESWTSASAPFEPTFDTFNGTYTFSDGTITFTSTECTDLNGTATIGCGSFYLIWDYDHFEKQ